MDVLVRMPDLGTVNATVKITQWFAEPGQWVQCGQPLLEVETDKAIVTIESVATGTLGAVEYPAGAEVEPGRVIATVAAADEAASEIRSGATDAWAPRPERSEQSRELVLELYERMVLIREFEEGVKRLFLEGEMPGTIHQCQGQEAACVGVCAALEPHDFITSTFRGHGHALAKGLTPEELLFELFGADTGCCRGKGGSMHVGNIEKGMVPGIAIVGGGIPLAAGMALAFKMRGQPQVVACFFGDGAVAEGAFHEGLNLAAIWDLPVLFVCENNLYGASTRIDRVMRNPRIADRAAAYGIEGECVDGNDVLAVYEAARSAAAECRAGRGPVLLELLTYRRTGHSRRDACHYQPEEERQAWLSRDPIELLGRRIMELGLADEPLLHARGARCQARFDAAVAAARCQRPPPVEELTTDVLVPGLPGEPATVSGATPAQRMSVAEALRAAIAEEMLRDPAVFCLGEDIAVPGGWGGAFTVTLGLEQKFPDRMLNTPIAELGFFGAAIGAAIAGMRPIVDVQYGDFLFLAMDQIVNNGAKLRYMSGGTIKVPLVMRAPVGATGRGAQHAQNMERFFSGVPGLRVVAPSNAYDAKGLLKAAVRDDNPVLIFEHKLLYGSKGARSEAGAVDATSDVPEGDYLVPLDRAAVRRAGSDVTLIGWLLMLHFALEAAEMLAALGIEAEVVDLRSLSPIDYGTIGESVEKTGRVVIVEEGPRTGGVSGEIAAGITERCAAHLRAPIVRVASDDVPVPFSPVLERAYRPDAARIAAAARRVLRSFGVVFLCACMWWLGLGSAAMARQAGEGETTFVVGLDRPHPWRGPFGLERVGCPLEVSVTSSARPPRAEFVLIALLRRREVGRYPIRFPASPPFSVRQPLTAYVDTLVLSAKGASGDERELVRQAIQLPEVEADAVARPDTIINPVDLNTVLLPSGWLLLGGGQSATLELAAICHTGEILRASLKAYYESAPDRAVTSSIALPAGRRVQQQTKLPPVNKGRERDSLVVVLERGTSPLWRKSIPVMLVADPPRHPPFGATYQRLRYDAPISVRDPKTGAFSAIPYATAWNPELRDVVVWLPNGARFVFWRGSSYIPFWAGTHNNCACYEWAEMISQPEGAVDCVEPLMDKELRYGRVEIVESTPARVHVRWSYQSTDFNYKVWGDEAVEDYYFYPDGFGTRVLNLKADPKNDYELSEFMILTAQGAYPFEVLPHRPVEALFLDGRRRSFDFPNPTPMQSGRRDRRDDEPGIPAIFRLRLSQKEDLSAVYFAPRETRMPPVVFAPFFDQGEMVTPCYWGSHWPLARGNSTGRTIDERIHFTPSHNSIMSWQGYRPAPLRTAEVTALDTLGRSRSLVLRRWAWLIGMTDAHDRELLDRARGFAAPPSLALRGARPEFDSYVPERRAIRLMAQERDVSLTFLDGLPCVNPVFEWTGAAPGDIQLRLGGRSLEATRFAWDGRTLWLDTTIESPTELRVSFKGDRATAP
jgi:2-oxoisovalerate dehydrogenase E1 component